MIVSTIVSIVMIDVAAMNVMRKATMIMAYAKGMFEAKTRWVRYVLSFPPPRGLEIEEGTKDEENCEDVEELPLDESTSFLLWFVVAIAACVAVVVVVVASVSVMLEFILSFWFLLCH